MRIRSIKPEFWRSTQLAHMSMFDRLLFIGLWSYVDDNGVGVDDHRVIAAELFALDDDPIGMREQVREGLARLSRGCREGSRHPIEGSRHPIEGSRTPLIARYVLDGRPLLFVTGWDQHQRVDRPARPRYPRPPADYLPPTSDDDNPRETLASPREDVARAREGLATGTGEQGNRGTGEQGKTDTRSEPIAAAGELVLVPPPAAPVARASSEPPGFEAFWSACPRKRGKGGARTAYGTALRKGATPEGLRRAMESAAVFWRRSQTEDKYIPYPATWLNDGRWEDDTSRPEAPAGSTTARINSAESALEEFRRRRASE